MKLLKNHKHTLCASYIGHITQAIINNFAPLLFLTFENQYNIPLSKITLLVAINFILQLIVDFCAASFVDKIGYRRCIVTAHMFCCIGLIGLGTLPSIMKDPFIGILISLVIYALGGGLIEVLIAPIVEACPSPHKAKNMSLLHFFYSIGHVGVVVFSALFFFICGIKNWQILALLWATIPFFNSIYFLFVPIYSLKEELSHNTSVKELLASKMFLSFVLLMFLSGASEQSMNQWASAFAEGALMNTSLAPYAKVLGDLSGPCIFALMMGLSRLLYPIIESKIKLEPVMCISSAICIVCYITASLCPIVAFKLIACGVCGFSIGIAWPGIYILAPKYCRGSCTALFALLALGGDLGCAAGPTVVGLISDKASLNLGLSVAAIFPCALLIGLLSLVICKKKRGDS